jgi:hypothetical protein
MKKNFLLLYLFVALVTLSSCKKTAYTHAIPADAAAVISIDMKSVAEKSGINDKENEALKQHLTDALKNGLNNETAERLTKILADPSESGFDLKEPVYAFSSKEFDYETVVDLCVGDKGDLNSTVEDLAKSQLCTPPEETDDYKFTVVMGKAVLAYNRGTALLVPAKSGMTDKVRSALDKVMKYKKEESFAADKAFEALNDRKGDVNFYLSTKESTSASSIFSQVQPKSAAKGMAFIGDMTFANGLISVKVEKMGASKQTDNNGLKPISNAVLANLPQHMPLMFTIGMDGAAAYKMLSADDALGVDALQIPLLEKLFDSVHGDLTIGYNSFGKSTPAFLAYAQIKDAAAVKSIYSVVKAQQDDEWGTIQKKSENDFVYSFMKTNIYYGIVGNLMYITNDASLVHYKVAGGTYAQNPYAAQTKGKSMFFVFDTSEITAQPAIQQKLGPLVSAALVQHVVCVRGFNQGVDSWNVEMIWKDKQTNALKQIVNIGRQIIAGK